MVNYRLYHYKMLFLVSFSVIPLIDSFFFFSFSNAPF